MAKKKNNKNKNNKSQHDSVELKTAPISGSMPLPNFAQAVFKERSSRFQKNGSTIDSVYEGLDFDPIRQKRRISSVLTVAEEVQERFCTICPDSPGKFSLAEDWVIMNSCPVSAFDYIEKYVFTTLGAAIWILDHIRDKGKIDKLNDILHNAPLLDDFPMPDVWDSCHSQRLLRQMVSIINNRNSDCPVTEKAIRKNKATVARIYMDRPTAENKIDHTVASRQLYDQIIALISPAALSQIENQYMNMYWEWLRRYFLCRSLFNQEEQRIRAEIDDFQNHTQAMFTKNAVLSQARKHFSILSNASTMGQLPAPDFKQDSDQLRQLRSLEYQNKILYDKQEEFNARFNSFTRDVGEFTLMPPEAIAKQYGEEIAAIWQGFEIDEPYSMCMAFLSLLDRNSDLPWCYFPSVVLQSCYVSMLPWTRTRHIPNCDDIWEHYDHEADAIVPGPSTQPLSKKIKVPDLDNWYRLQYHDTAKTNADHAVLFNLSQILYEVTGCIMPRKPERHLVALNTLYRYGINNKKANQNLLYCMALLAEAKHQSQFSQIPVSQESASEELPDAVDELKAQVIALREELSQCHQALQDVANKNSARTNQKEQLQRQLTHRDYLIHDLSTVVFNSKLPINPNGGNFPYRVASNYVVFSTDEGWLNNMHEKLPDIQFFPKLTKANCKTIRSTDTIWIQPKDMSFDEYRCILAEARKSDIPVRIFPFDDANSCASLMVHADIAR